MAAIWLFCSVVIALSSVLRNHSSKLAGHQEAVLTKKKKPAEEKILDGL
jgi:hypothetical protein